MGAITYACPHIRWITSVKEVLDGRYVQNLQSYTLANKIMLVYQITTVKHKLFD